MGAIGTGNLTLLDLASRMVDGQVEKNIIELLSQQNEIIDDAVWVECNNGTVHKTVIRTGIPAGTWRLLNYGVKQEKSTTAMVQDGTGMLEAYSTVDASLVNMAKDKAGLRLSEDKPFIEGMNQTFAEQLFYGNVSTNPERWTGLAPRYSSLEATNGVNILDGGGQASTNASIWLAVWGDNTVHCTYPDGSKAGLAFRDLGEQTVYDTSGGLGNPFQAFRSHYKWDSGLVVRDWRYIVRIANIDVTDLTKDASEGSADLVDLMTTALEQVKDLVMGRPAFYCGRTIRQFLRRQEVNHKNMFITEFNELAGKHITEFCGVPVRRCDQLLKTEAQVV